LTNKKILIEIAELGTAEKYILDENDPEVIEFFKNLKFQDIYGGAISEYHSLNGKPDEESEEAKQDETCETLEFTDATNNTDDSDYVDEEEKHDENYETDTEDEDSVIEEEQHGEI
jgi:hypothetical protein